MKANVYFVFLSFFINHTASAFEIVSIIRKKESIL